MAVIDFEGQPYPLEEGESVLDLLLRHGHSIPHACKAGVCGSCMMQSVKGEVPANAQSGIKESWKAQGYFYSCVCRPAHSMTVSQGASAARIPAVIQELTPLSADVLRVRLNFLESGFAHRAGQYLTLVRDEQLARPYSIASLPGDGFVELHVRLLPGGRMSGWLSAEAATGNRVQLLGPSGECFYVEGRPDQPLLLIGTGTGLAPLYGIVRDALANGHRGEIHLFHGALRSSGLYLADELRELEGLHPQFRYVPTLFEKDGAIDQMVLTRIPKLGGWRAFLCGDPALVQTLKKKLFLAGMSSRDIYADAFLPSAS